MCPPNRRYGEQAGPPCIMCRLGNIVALLVAHYHRNKGHVRCGGIFISLSLAVALLHLCPFNFTPFSFVPVSLVSLSIANNFFWIVLVTGNSHGDPRPPYVMPWVARYTVCSVLGGDARRPSIPLAVPPAPLLPVFSTWQRIV